jgi:hypothetical protein
VSNGNPKGRADRIDVRVSSGTYGETRAGRARTDP